VHTLERDQREMATAVAEFWAAQPAPPRQQEGEILVCTADGKGVAPPSTGEKRAGTKKMALVGAVYTVAPFMRTPDEVLDALFQDTAVGEPPPSRPRPCFKYVWAALQRDEEDSTEPQVQAIFAWMAAQVAQRNPNGMSPVVLLMDGQESLWQAGWTYLPATLAEVTEILDLLHALGYLWEAAHLFHPNGSDAARAFVKERARRLLHGEVAAVIHSLRWLATHHNLEGKRRETLERICGYFHNNVQAHGLRRLPRARLPHCLRCHRRGLPVCRQGPHGAFRNALGHVRRPRDARYALYLPEQPVGAVHRVPHPARIPAPAPGICRQRCRFQPVTRRVAGAGDGLHPRGKCISSRHLRSGHCARSVVYTLEVGKTYATGGSDSRGVDERCAQDSP
jgi:hypothetical protein